MLALILHFLPAAAIAEESVLIDRARVVNEALTRSAEVRAAREQLGFPEGDLLDAKRLFVSNPTIDGEYGSDALLDNSGERRAGIGLSQELEIGFQRGLRRERAELKVREARARLRHLELRVARDAADAYFALWRAERLRALALDAMEVNRSLQRAAESRFGVGDISELERNVVDIDVARAEAAVAAAEAEWRRAGSEVNRLMGMPIQTELKVADEPPPPLPTTDIVELLKIAPVGRYDLSAARLAEDAATTEISLRRRELIPNPTFSVGYGREVFFVAGALSNLGEVRLDHASTFLLAKLSLPIPMWDRQQGEIRRAKAARGVAEAEREGTERLVSAEVQSAASAAQSARRALDAYEATVPRVARNLELLERAYRAGQVDLSALLVAKDRALATCREHVETQAIYGRSVDELLRASGRFPTGAQP